MKVFRITAVTLGITAVIAVLGPRPSVDVAEALEGWTPVEASPPYRPDADARMTPGAEKSITWADSAHARTALAFVYLHGFSATRQELHPVMDSVSARLGANVFYARLTGHGLPGEALGDATAAEWIRDVAESVAVGRALGSRLVLVGTSTGATLAAIVASQPEVFGLRDDELAASVWISPNFGPLDAKSEVILWPWGRQLTALLAGEWRTWTPSNEAQGRYWTTRYRTTVLPEMMAMVDAARDAPLEAIAAPVFVVHSDRDRVISTERVMEAAGRVPQVTRWDVTASGDPEVLDELGRGSYHVIAGQILAPAFTPIVVDSIEAFVRRVVE